MQYNKIKFLLIIFFLLTINYFLFPITYAATPTKNPTPTSSKNTIPTDSIELEKIQKIKDIVASKVAELDLVEKRGLIGKIKENRNMHLTIVDMKGNSRNIDVDELTNFSIGTKDKKNTLGVSDLKENTIYSFVGLYNKDNQRLLARTISISENIPVFFEGVIISTNSKEFQITVVNAKGEEKTIDIQGSTKTNISTITGELEKSGFTKLAVNQRVLIVGFNDIKDENFISATRIVHFEKLPPSREMQQYINTVNPGSI